MAAPSRTGQAEATSVGAAVGRRLKELIGAAPKAATVAGTDGRAAMVNVNLWTMTVSCQVGYFWTIKVSCQVGNLCLGSRYIHMV